MLDAIPTPLLVLLIVCAPGAVILAWVSIQSYFRNRRHAGYAARARAVNALIEDFHGKSRG